VALKGIKGKKKEVHLGGEYPGLVSVGGGRFDFPKQLNIRERVGEMRPYGKTELACR